MHVETEESDILARRRHFRDGKRLVEGNSELHPLLACAGVWVRRINQHFRIYPQRDGSDDSDALRDGIESVQLLLGLDVDDKYFRAERLLHLPLRLADSAEDDVPSGISGFESAEQLATRDDI